MVSILTLGNPRDLRLFHALQSILLPRGPVLSVCRGKSRIPPEQPSFFLGDCGLSGRVAGRALLAIKDTDPLPAILRAGEESLVILCSHNPQAVRLVASTGLPAVTCGLSPRDTVTFSSRGKEEGTVALQRPLVLPGGQMVDPGEVPIRFPPSWDAYTVLCCAAVAALLDGTDRELTLGKPSALMKIFSNDPRKN